MTETTWQKPFDPFTTGDNFYFHQFKNWNAFIETTNLN